MTEESFQQGRKFMQSANLLRGHITNAKGQVSKWGNIEDSHRKELRESQADGAKKILEKAIKKLEELKAKFAAMKFPDSDIVVTQTERVQCEGCGAPIAKGNTYCGECLVED
jgi:hypothetical protein